MNKNKKSTREELEEKINNLEKQLQKERLKNKDLEKQIIYDPITGLYSRAGFEAMASKELTLAKRQEQTVFMAYADLDNFKQINDTYNHDTGDEALKDTANVLKNVFRQSDILARKQGDEFVGFGIANENWDEASINERAQAYLAEYAKQYKRPYTLSISIGFRRFKASKAPGINDMMRHADTRMYKQKNGKKIK